MIFTRFIKPTSQAPWNPKTHPLRDRLIQPTNSRLDTYEIQKNPVSQCWENTASSKKICTKPSTARSLRSSLYFGMDTKKTPPIPYLLTETQEDPIPQKLPRQLSLLKALCRGKGTVKEKNGFVYIQIDDFFTEPLFTILEKQNSVQKTPQIFPPDGPKTHIPVIGAQETVFHHLETIQEINQEISFKITGFYAIKPTLWNEVEQVWYLEVESSELEKLRRKYFLATKMGGNPFYMTVAIQRHPHSKRSFPLMRINPANTAA